MKRLFSHCIACIIILTIAVTKTSAENIEIDLSNKGAEINPIMWGIFFEDINFAADGGLSAELIKNRGFEFPDPLMGWKINVKGQESHYRIANNNPFNPKNPNYLQLMNNNENSKVEVLNEGFRGIGIKKDETYIFNAWIRGQTSGKGVLEVSLVSPTGDVLASGKIMKFQSDWQKISLNLKSKALEPKANLRLTFEGKGRLDIDWVSLYPRKTWKNRPNGLRADIVKMLADMKPGFVRFPGGCIVEGRTLDNRYQWKNTIGKPEERKLIVNRWNMEFKHRPAPDYYQSYALGFFEFFQLCEDIGAEPMPILNCGMACQFNSGELAPLEEIDKYIQDALDLIEFANGDVSTKWGKVRAELGHPKPFNLKMLGVGNEQWGPQYIERYKVFAEKIKKKYPDIILISSAGPDPDGQKFEYLWGELRKLNADIIDEHYYRSPSWFLKNVNRYDSYDRKGPKVFAGEYAAQSVGVARPDNKNTLECALAEAAFMTGLERNADVVRLASYAPLLAHVDAWQWTPDLIWFDNLSVYATPSYYVQKMYSLNRGDFVITLKITDSDSENPLFATSSYDKKTSELIIKVVNPYGRDKNCKFSLKNCILMSKTVKIEQLAGNAPDLVNSPEKPFAVAPVVKTAKIDGEDFSIKLPRYSFSVLRIKTKLVE